MGGLFPSEESLRVQIEPRLIVHKKVRCRRKPCVIPTFQAHNCENINVIAAPGLKTKTNQCLSSSSNLENQHHRLSGICIRCVYKDIQMYAWLSQQSLTKLSIYVCINQVQQWLNVLYTDNYKIHLFFWCGLPTEQHSVPCVFKRMCRSLYLHSCKRTGASQVKALASCWPSGILCEQTLTIWAVIQRHSATAAFPPNIALPV